MADRRQRRRRGIVLLGLAALGAGAVAVRMARQRTPENPWATAVATPSAPVAVGGGPAGGPSAEPGAPEPGAPAAGEGPSAAAANSGPATLFDAATPATSRGFGPRGPDPSEPAGAAFEPPRGPAAQPYGPGSAAPLPDGSAPGPEFTIKGNATSMLFHLPSSPYYERTKAEAWFRTPEDAERAGFTEWKPRPRSS